MDQLALSFLPPGIGHNQPPEGIDPIEALNARLTANHADLLTRFCDLELACGRVPDPIASEEDAATATDFIAQCQLHIKGAEREHRKEKELFLRAGRSVDAFFKRRSEKLNSALAPIMARLKVYRDWIAETERQRYHEARHRAEEEARQVLAEIDVVLARAAQAVGEDHQRERPLGERPLGLLAVGRQIVVGRGFRDVDLHRHIPLAGLVVPVRPAVVNPVGAALRLVEVLPPCPPRGHQHQAHHQRRRDQPSHEILPRPPARYPSRFEYTSLSSPSR